MKIILTIVSPILIWSNYIASLFTASNLMHVNFLLIFCSKSYRIFSLKFTFGCCGPEMKVIIIMFIVWLPTYLCQFWRNCNPIIESFNRKMHGRLIERYQLGRKIKQSNFQFSRAVVHQSSDFF
jgi:hypothetical protein